MSWLLIISTWCAASHSAHNSGLACESDRVPLAIGKGVASLYKPGCKSAVTEDCASRNPLVKSIWCKSLNTSFFSLSFASAALIAWSCFANVKILLRWTAELVFSLQKLVQCWPANILPRYLPTGLIDEWNLQPDDDERQRPLIPSLPFSSQIKPARTRSHYECTDASCLQAGCVFPQEC